MDRDYYNVLGVTPRADAEEIKRAYRALALRWHPDRNPGDPIAEARFKDINEAHRVLSDPELRARYDRTGPLFNEDGRPPRPDEVTEVVSRMWDNLWGRRKRTRGEDLRYTLSVTLEEVNTGSSRDVGIHRLARCPTCSGHGATAAQRKVCTACEGSGRSSGARLLRTQCYHCQGRGYLITAHCETCGGDGRTSQQEALKVKVPPGVATGQKLKVTGKGNDAADGGPPGDLLVLVDVADHALFRRRGDDVVAEVPLTYAEAALGAELRVPTLDGTTFVRIPPGTPHGRVLRLAGRGLPKTVGRGDLHLEISVEIPSTLDDAERARLAAWSASLPPERHPRRAAWLEALKER